MSDDRNSEIEHFLQIFGLSSGTITDSCHHSCAGSHTTIVSMCRTPITAACRRLSLLHWTIQFATSKCLRCICRWERVAIQVCHHWTIMMYAQFWCERITCYTSLLFEVLKVLRFPTVFILHRWKQVASQTEQCRRVMTRVFRSRCSPFCKKIDELKWSKSMQYDGQYVEC